MALLKKTLRDLDPAGRRILVRVDFNVPLSDGEVGDDTRIAATLPSLRDLLARGGRVILVSHLGRPKGGPDARFSLRPVAARLERMLREPVAFCGECVGAEAEAAAGRLGDGQVVLLENLRFHPEEEKNDPAFAAALARLGEAYVNDAFGAAHRAHASTEGVPRILKPAVAGLLMERELEYLGGALERPARPFVAILGGAKISGKIDVITALLPKVDRLLIGGAMMFTFLRAQGISTGRSLVEEDKVELAGRVLADAAARKAPIELPVDCVVSTAADGKAPVRIITIEGIGEDEMGLDIGPATLNRFEQVLHDAKTVLWNGPMGVFEVPAFAAGTLGVARILAAATSRGATTIVGGGDSVAAVQEADLAGRLTHLSTGGGASLEFLEGRTLPGVAALDDRPA